MLENMRYDFFFPSLYIIVYTNFKSSRYGYATLGKGGILIYHHFAEWSAVLFTIFIRYLMSICVIDSVTSDHLYILHTTTISTIIGDFYYDRKETSM